MQVLRDDGLAHLEESVAFVVGAQGTPVAG
jgi:hypothetical protein